MYFPSLREVKKKFKFLDLFITFQTTKQEKIKIKREKESNKKKRRKRKTNTDLVYYNWKRKKNSPGKHTVRLQFVEVLFFKKFSFSEFCGKFVGIGKSKVGIETENGR